MTTKKTTAETPVEVTPEQEQIEQLQAQAAVSDQRIKELAGYQAEVRGQRDTVTALTEKLDAVTAERDQAVKDAAAARAAAQSATDSSSTDTEKVGHAHALAAAIKGLLG